MALGSNQGNRAEHLKWAVHYLNKSGEVVRRSPRYANPPEGFQSDEAFENAVVFWKTHFEPEEALDYLLAGEKERGRPQRADGQSWSDRTLDMDLLLWSGGTWKSDSLTLPHPRMSERIFVMVPLMQIHPQGEHFDLPEGTEKMVEVGTL